MRSPYIPGVVGVLSSSRVRWLPDAVRGAWRYQSAGGSHQSGSRPAHSARAVSRRVNSFCLPFPGNSVAFGQPMRRSGACCSIYRASAPLTSPPSDYAPLGATFYADVIRGSQIKERLYWKTPRTVRRRLVPKTTPPRPRRKSSTRPCCSTDRSSGHTSAQTSRPD